MRFLIDEAAPIAFLSALIDLGHEADHVALMDISGATDSIVFEAAQARSAILVTPDLDFSDERIYPPGTHAGIVVLRTRHGSRPAVMAKRIAQRLVELDESDIVGNIVIMEPDRTRIRRKEQ